METLIVTNSEQGFVLKNNSLEWTLKRDYGFSPVQMLVSATGSCGGYVYESILLQSGIDAKVERISCTYEQDVDVKGKPVKFINLVFDIRVDDEQKDRALRALKSVSDFCPVMRSLNPKIIVTKEANFIE